MKTAPPALRRLLAGADAARRTAERLETGDQVLTPLLADLDGLDLVSGRWIEPLLSVADGSAALERLLEPSPPSPLSPHRSPSPGEGRLLAALDSRALGSDLFEGEPALGGRVPPPLGGGVVGSGKGQAGGFPANPHPPAPSPLSHPAPRRERGREAERTEGTERTQEDDRFSDALLSKGLFSPSPGDRVGGRWERGPGGEDSAPRRSVLPGPAGEPPSWPPPLPTAPRPGREEKSTLLAGSPLSRGGGEGGRERGAREVRARLGDVLQRLESVRPTLQPPSSTLSTPDRDLPTFPSSLGGLRGLAALASSISVEEPPSSPALQASEPDSDDLVERLERLLRREAHRHGIEVEP